MQTARDSKAQPILNVNEPTTLRKLAEDLSTLDQIMSTPGPFDTSAIVTLTSLHFTTEQRADLIRQFQQLDATARKDALGTIRGYR